MVDGAKNRAGIDELVAAQNKEWAGLLRAVLGKPIPPAICEIRVIVGADIYAGQIACTFTGSLDAGGLFCMTNRGDMKDRTVDAEAGLRKALEAVLAARGIAPKSGEVI